MRERERGRSHRFDYVARERLLSSNFAFLLLSCARLEGPRVECRWVASRIWAPRYHCPRPNCCTVRRHTNMKLSLSLFLPTLIFRFVFSLASREPIMDLDFTIAFVCSSVNWCFIMNIFFMIENFVFSFSYRGEAFLHK